MIINPHTYQIDSGKTSLILTFNAEGNLVTTHEYNRVSVKRVSVQATKKEIKELIKFLVDNCSTERK